MAAALVRAWTAAYTWGMPQDVRQARRAEIDSDLWDCQHGEPPDTRLPLQIMARLVLGIPDDLGWRREHPCLPRRAAHLAWGFVVAMTVAAILATVWMGRAQTLPAPVPRLRTAERKPLPPPPPPSPCTPSGAVRPSVTPCSRF